MRTLYALIFLLAGTVALVWADDAVTVSSSKLVSVSTTTTGTAILSADHQAKKTCLVNSTTDYMLLGDDSTTFSTSASTGTFRLPGTATGTTPQPFCLDGPTAPYKGSVKGVSGGSGSIVIGVIREK